MIISVRGIDKGSSGEGLNLAEVPGYGFIQRDTPSSDSMKICIYNFFKCASKNINVLYFVIFVMNVLFVSLIF